MGTTVTISLMPAHHLLHRYRSSGRANVRDFVKLWKIPAGFRSNVCKHVGFSVSRHERGEKVTGKINMQTLPSD